MVRHAVVWNADTLVEALLGTETVGPDELGPQPWPARPAEGGVMT
jgi:hypothetical protein